MRLTYLQIKIAQNRPNNLFRSKQTTNKLALIFEDVKKLKEK